MQEETAQFMFETEAELKTYYPLEFCLIVESRLKKRKEIVSKIRGSGLFRNIFEPESVAAALVLIDQRPLDVCIIGPSLSIDSTELIVKHAAKSSFQNNIAFLAFGRDNPTDLERLSNLGITHSLPPRTTPRVFYEGLARAVLTSNFGSEDERVQHFDENSPFSIRIKNRDQKNPENKFGNLVIIDCVDDNDENYAKYMFGHVMNRAHSAENLKTESLEEIREFVQQLAINNRESKLFQDFLNYFNRAYGEWFTDAFLYNPKEADQRLRTKVLKYGNKHTSTSQ